MIDRGQKIECLYVFLKIRDVIYFYCHTVHVVELVNDYTNHCTYIKFIKFTH